METNTRIDRLIREAHVQRSAYIGMLLGQFLGEAWLGAANLFSREAPTRAAAKPVPAR